MSVVNEISAVPSKATPAIFLLVAKAVAVDALPVNAPVKVVAATLVNPLIFGLSDTVNALPADVVVISLLVPAIVNVSLSRSMLCTPPESP